MYPEAALQDGRNQLNRGENMIGQAWAAGQIKGGGLVGSQTKEIQARIDRLSHSLDSLSSTALRLADRLAPVLGPAMPQPETGKVNAPDMTHIGSQLSELTNRVHAIGNKLEDALERLEL